MFVEPTDFMLHLPTIDGNSCVSLPSSLLALQLIKSAVEFVTWLSLLSWLRYVDTVSKLGLLPKNNSFFSVQIHENYRKTLYCKRKTRTLNIHFVPDFVLLLSISKTESLRMLLSQFCCVMLLFVDL